MFVTLEAIAAGKSDSGNNTTLVPWFFQNVQFALYTVERYGKKEKRHSKR